MYVKIYTYKVLYFEFNTKYGAFSVDLMKALYLTGCLLQLLYWIQPEAQHITSTLCGARKDW